MRIVQTVTLVSEDGAFGGPLAVAMEQCRELARRGHDVTLLAAWDGRSKLTIPGVRVVLSRGKRLPRVGFSGVFAPALSRWLSTNKDRIDLIHVHAGRHAVDLDLARTARRLRIPYFIQTHGMIMPKRSPLVTLLDHVITRPILRSAAGVLVLTVREAAGIGQIESSAHVETVRNGVDGEFRPREPSENKPEVLFLARLHPRKRVMAFAAMAKILAEKKIDATFAVVGPDEGDLQALERFMAENPAVPLKYEGPVPPGQGTARIGHADVFVLPSLGEVFPMAVLEALGAGTAVVLNQDCGIASRLSQAGAASLSDGTPLDLADKVEELLQQPTLRSRRAQVGRELVETELGASSMIEEILSLYAAAYRQASRARVVWVTNQAAPYRIPVWEALSERVSLEVWLLESDRKLKRDQNNRGNDWEVGERAFSFSIRTLRTLSVRRGEARHYFTGWLGRNAFRGVDSVLVGGWESPAFWAVARRAKKAGVRRIGFYESHLLTQKKSRGLFAEARRRFFNSLDGVVVPGVAARDALAQQGLRLDAIHVGFNAVDGELIRQLTDSERDRLDDRRPAHLRMLIVGQLIPRKNVESAILALRRPGMETATLTVVGTGPLQKHLEDLVERNGLGDRVHFVGYLPASELPAMFAQHDVLVHPALEEVWGLVVNEALAAGLSVLVSDRCGVVPSIRGMQGVSVIVPTADSIATAVPLLRNRAPIADSPILEHSPARFAEVFNRALFPSEGSSGGPDPIVADLPVRSRRTVDARSPRSLDHDAGDGLLDEHHD